MASIEALQLGHLTENDIAAAMALSAEAGWNQTADDWSLFVRHGTVFGLPDGVRRAVATGAILPYANGFAWISMVLVTAARRRERIGTHILQTCCAELTRRELVGVLDATPAGERVYRPLGFEPMLALTRWQGEGSGDAAPRVGIRSMTQSDLPAIAALDTAAFGAVRMFLIESLFRRAPLAAFVSASAGAPVAGFSLARPGRIATQIGPIVAPDETTAAPLLDAALASVRGPVFLDLIDRWDGLKRMLTRRGFTIQRPYLRMGLGRAKPFGGPERLFVIAGPEFG